MQRLGLGMFCGRRRTVALPCQARQAKSIRERGGGGGSGKLTGTNCQNAHVTAHMGGGTVKHEEHSSQGH